MGKSEAYRYLQVTRPPDVKSLRGHSRELTNRLAELLARGVTARVDSQRDGFFEVTDGNQVFYVHISPVSPAILLLAIWSHVTDSQEPSETLSEALA
jgi:hypothetical protein